MQRIVRGLSRHRARLRESPSAVPRTPCHGDANRQNVRRLTAAPDSFPVSERAGVCNGAVGEAPVRLIHPWPVVASGCSGRDDLAACEADLTQADLDVLRAGDRTLDLAAVRAAFEIRSAVWSVPMARTCRAWLGGFRDRGRRARATGLVRDFYGMIADRVDRLEGA